MKIDMPDSLQSAGIDGSEGTADRTPIPFDI